MVMFYNLFFNHAICLTLARFPYFATFASVGGGCVPPSRIETKRHRA